MKTNWIPEEDPPYTRVAFRKTKQISDSTRRAGFEREGQKEAIEMTEQEKINSETQMKLALQDVKFEAFMRSHEDFKNEMRDRDNQRAAEIMELRADIKSTLKHIQGLATAAMVGIGAIAVGILGFLWSTARHM